MNDELMIDLDKELATIEKRWITEAMARTGQRKKAAAKLLGISFRSFRYRLAKYFGEGA